MPWFSSTPDPEAPKSNPDVQEEKNTVENEPKGEIVSTGTDAVTPAQMGKVASSEIKKVTSGDIKNVGSLPFQVGSVQSDLQMPSLDQIPQTESNENEEEEFPGETWSYQVPPSLAAVVPIPGILPGLEYLVGLYHMFIRPFLDIEALANGTESYLRHEVVNISGERLYLSNETSTVTSQYCMRENRPFEVNVYDKTGMLVFCLQRPMTISLVWWGGYCCGSVLTIHHGNGQLLGTIIQKQNPFIPTFNIFDVDGELVLQIRGPRCLFGRWIMRQYDFFVYLPEDKRIPAIGRITKEWGGRNPKMFSQVDTGVECPSELAPIHKALLLGAVFLIEFQFFEPHHRDPRWNSQSCTGFKLFTTGFIFLTIFICFYYFALVARY